MQLTRAFFTGILFSTLFSFAAGTAGGEDIFDAGSVFSKSSPHDFSLDELENLYVYLAFGSELEKVSEGYRPLVKRAADQKPIVLALPMKSNDAVPGGRDALIEKVEDVADTISEHLGDVVFRSLSPSQLTTYLESHQNGTATDTVRDRLTVIIGDDREIRGILGRYSGTGMEHVGQAAVATLERTQGDGNFCVLLTGTDETQPGLISEQTILIRTGSDIEACLYEEMMHSFGLTNDFPPGSPSIFSDDDVHRIPTELDWFFLKTQSDDRLKAGMSEDQVRLELQKIIPDIIEQGGEDG